MMGWLKRADVLLAGGALLSVAAIAAALWSQHGFDMQPCPWCVLQRVIFAAIAIACLVGLVWRSAGARRVVAGFVGVLAVSGVTAALWQHFVAAASDSCKLTLADRIIGALRLDVYAPDVFQARASCAEAAVSLLGVPYEYYSLVLFVVLGVAAGWVFIRPLGDAR